MWLDELMPGLEKEQQSCDELMLRLQMVSKGLVYSMLEAFM